MFWKEENLIVQKRIGVYVNWIDLKPLINIYIQLKNLKILLKKMIKIPCKYHPNSFVERICASSSCKRDPTLCWECMIDEADHARNHRDVMVFLNLNFRLILKILQQDQMKNLKMYQKKEKKINHLQQKDI